MVRLFTYAQSRLLYDIYTHGRLGSWNSCSRMLNNKDVILSLHLVAFNLIMLGPLRLQLENWDWRLTSLYSDHRLRYHSSSVTVCLVFQLHSRILLEQFVDSDACFNRYIIHSHWRRLNLIPLGCVSVRKWLSRPSVWYFGYTHVSERTGLYF